MDSPGLHCANPWCDDCPAPGVSGRVCDRTDEILAAGRRYEAEAQAALDVFDITHPEVALAFLAEVYGTDRPPAPEGDSR